jgi:hypothetical protein
VPFVLTFQHFTTFHNIFTHIKLKIFGPQRDEVTGGWRKLHNEELHNLYSSPSIIRMIKSRRMRGSDHVARMGDNPYRILVGKPERRDHWDDKGVDGWTILKWKLEILE